MLELLGWIGAIALGICALPQAWQSFRTKSSRDINSAFLYLWIVGEIATLIYICLTTVQIPLIVNYTFNLMCLLVILFYRRQR